MELELIGKILDLNHDVSKSVTCRWSDCQSGRRHELESGLDSISLRANYGTRVLLTLYTGLKL